VIRRIHVRGYKSLADAQTDLAPVSVLFGPNGAGKSNLLDLIGLLSRLASRETVREAFEGHRGRPLEAFHSPRGFSREAYESVVKGSKRLAFQVTVDIEIHPRIVRDINESLQRREQAVGATVTYTKVTETRLRYSLEIAMHPSSGELFVSDESLLALRKDFQPRAETSRLPFFERERDRFVARVERQSHPRYFDLDRPRTLLSELTDAVYHPHVVAAAREVTSWRVYYVEPSRMRAEVPVQGADDPGRAGELLAAYYYSLQQKHPSTLRSLVKNLQGIDAGLQDLRVDVREGLLELTTIQAAGAEFPARLLSEGTLRLLCVLGLAVAPNPPATIVYEEPENGVNPARLDLVTDIIRHAAEIRDGGSQFIITTHSPLVCSALHSHLVRCDWTESGGTRFRAFPWKPDTLYFETEVIRALDRPDA
jgi:predicted ATPase